MKHTVCIDPGHGGQDSGAVGISNGISESFCVLNIGLTVRDILSEYMNVFMTRETDNFVGLKSRCKIANEYPGCEAFVSIHLNSAENTKASGFEIYTSGSVSSLRLSNNISTSHTNSFTSQRDRGVKETGFYVLRNTSMPATLYEGCFLSNEAENEWVTNEEVQKQMGKAIAEGVLTYFNIEFESNNNVLTISERLDRVEKRLGIT